MEMLRGVNVANSMLSLKRSLYSHWPIARTLILGMTPIVLIACAASSDPSQPTGVNQHIRQLATVTLDPTEVTVGQTLYVPVYSHIYHHNRPDQIINLATTLSIRNTDLEHPITLTSVRYYDTNGVFIRQYTEAPVELPPLASTEVFIQTDDLTGGTGANFIVEWVATTPVYAPVVEAVIISTASSQGISFITSGRVLRQFGQLKPLEQPAANKPAAQQPVAN